MKDWEKSYTDLLARVNMDHNQWPLNGAKQGSAEKAIEPKNILSEDEMEPIKQFKTNLYMYNQYAERFKEIQIKNLQDKFDKVDGNGHECSQEMHKPVLENTRPSLRDILNYLDNETHWRFEQGCELQMVARNQIAYLKETLKHETWQELANYCNDSHKLWNEHSGLHKGIYAKYFERLHNTANLAAAFEKSLEEIEKEQTFQSAISKLRRAQEPRQITTHFGNLSLAQSSSAVDSVRGAEGLLKLS